jgi:hypothetical protein
VSSAVTNRLVEVTTTIVREAKQAQALEVLQRLMDQIVLRCTDGDRIGRAIDTLAYHRKALINAVATGDGVEMEFQAAEIRERLRLPRTIQHREDNTGRVNENGRE